MKRLLLNQGYEVETAADGMAALAIIQQHIPDLVLTDVMMPRLDGFGLLRELRTTATTREIPIIMLSARAGEEAWIEGLEAGADDYLTKPFSARELLARVEANLKLAQLRRETAQKEQALRLEAESAKQTVETILSSISDGFYTLDRHWRYTYVNDRYCEMAGMEREALLGKGIWDLFADAVNTDVYVQFQRVMSEQTPLQFEYLYVIWNRWYEHRVYSSPNGLTVFVAEITDRKQTEAEIQQLNQLLTHRVNELETLFDLLPVGVAIAQDPECRVIRVNPYLSELIRVPVNANASQSAPPGERPVYRLYRDDQEIPAADLPMQYAAFHNTVVRDEVVDIVHPDGTVIKLLCYASPLLDEQGNVRGVIGGFADITQRIQKEVALREQRTLLETILRQAADGIIVCDATGKLTFVNKEARRLAQQDPDGTTLDLNLLDWGTAYDTDGNLIPLESYAISKALQGEVSNGFEARMVRQDGSYYDILVSAAPLWNEKQEIIGAVNTFIDISDRKRTEQALRRSEERFRISQELSLDAFTILDSVRDQSGRIVDFVWTYVNPKAGEILQRSVEELMGQRLLEVLPGNKTNSELFERYVRVVETGEPHDIELSYCADGITGWFRNMTVKLGDGVAISFSDITQRKQTETALRESEERLRLALTAANQGLYDLNVQTGDAVVSPEYARMLGYEPDEFQETNAKWRSRLHPDDIAAVSQAYEDYIAGRRDTYRVEFRQRTKSGDWKWILSLGKIVSWDSQGQPLRMLGTHTDITDRKQAEAERERLLQQAQAAREEAERANRIKDEFLAVLSHELRSPLNPILGWSKLLQTRQFDPQGTKRALQTIERNAKLQVQLIEDLLDVSRILRGKMVLNVCPVNLVTVVESALETVRLAAEAKKFTSEPLYPSRTPRFRVMQPDCNKLSGI